MLQTKSLAALQASIKSLQAQVETLTQEMGTDLADALSPADQRDKARLTREVEALQKELTGATDKRVEVSARVTETRA